jgi:hypothetical protein
MQKIMQVEHNFSFHTSTDMSSIPVSPLLTRTGLLTTTKAVMSAPLPRVYEETGGGKVVAIGTGPNSQAVLPIGGTDFSAEELARISKETGKKLESEVLAPMERWMNAFALVANRMKKLESLRLEVDSRRRTVAKLGKKVDVQRAKLPQTRARGEYEMENTIKALQHKESKLSACRQSFKEHEALVYHQLTNLIRDTVWLKSYLSAVLRVEAEAFQAANVALGQMKAAVPMSGHNMSSAEVPVAQPATTANSTPALVNDAIPAAGNVDRSRVKKAVSSSRASKDSSIYTMPEPPAVPTHKPQQQEPAGYDRYASSQPVPAW